jgi:virginiamycin B lyase
LSNAGDGALWATDNVDEELVRFDLSAHTATVLGSAQGVTGDATADAEGPSGNLWFTEADADQVGRVTVSGPAAPAPVALAEPRRSASGSR